MASHCASQTEMHHTALRRTTQVCTSDLRPQASGWLLSVGKPAALRSALIWSRWLMNWPLRLSHIFGSCSRKLLSAST